MISYNPLSIYALHTSFFKAAWTNGPFNSLCSPGVDLLHEPMQFNFDSFVHLTSLD